MDEEGRRASGALRGAITSPSHHSHPQPDLQQGIVVTLLLCFVAFVFCCFCVSLLFTFNVYTSPPPNSDLT